MCKIWDIPNEHINIDLFNTYVMLTELVIFSIWACMLM